MKTTKHFLSAFVQGCIVLGMLTGVALMIDLFVYEMPIVTEFFAKEGKPQAYAAISGVIATLCILGGEYIAFTLLCMMRTLDSDPFVEKNVKALRRMGAVALIIALLGAGTLLLHPVPLAVIAAAPVAMCGLFSLVLSRVFAQAVAYKQENDLTV
ncbi:MAG: DUF2975 domain-containing protein [Clostridiales bacterium]|nr:DUF2975 domain-containing protein [Clostridiales bacterium]